MARIIVVGVDGSVESSHALGRAMQEAELRGALLEVVYAWQSPIEYWTNELTATTFPLAETAQREYINKEIKKVKVKHPNVDSETLLVYEPAAHALLDRAKGADLLIVGSRGCGGFDGLLLGSVAEQVVHHSTCPVLVVPPPNAFKSRMKI